VLNVIAVHEAGHAVVAWYYKVPIYYVGIRPTTGRMQHSERITNEVLAALTYGGIAAERRVNPGATWHSVHFATDTARLEQLFAKMFNKAGDGMDEFFDSVLKLTRRLWPYIEALAIELDKFKWLSSEDVSEILKDCPQSP
jgi:hypothetical protein